MRRRTRQIHVGDVAIGGDAPIAVQSMTTTYTRDVESTVAFEQLLQLQAGGLVVLGNQHPPDGVSRIIVWQRGGSQR